MARNLLPVCLALASATTAWAQAPAVGSKAVVIALEVRPRAGVAETPMIVTLTDRDGQPLVADSARGRAEFSSGGLRGTATLHPDGGNRLKGYGLMSARPDLTIAVSVTLPGRPAATATFTPLRKE